MQALGERKIFTKKRQSKASMIVEKVDHMKTEGGVSSHMIRKIVMIYLINFKVFEMYVMIKQLNIASMQ